MLQIRAAGCAARFKFMLGESELGLWLMGCVRSGFPLVTTMPWGARALHFIVVSTRFVFLALSGSLETVGVG